MHLMKIPLTLALVAIIAMTFYIGPPPPDEQPITTTEVVHCHGEQHMGGYIIEEDTEAVLMAGSTLFLDGGDLVVWGGLRFEGRSGAVKIEGNGSIIFKGRSYGIFNNTMINCSGTPIKAYGGYIWLRSCDITGAETALELWDTELFIDDCRFVDCETGIWMWDGALEVEESTFDCSGLDFNVTANEVAIKDYSLKPPEGEFVFRHLYNFKFNDRDGDALVDTNVTLAKDDVETEYTTDEMGYVHNVSLPWMDSEGGTYNEHSGYELTVDFWQYHYPIELDEQDEYNIVFNPKDAGYMEPLPFIQVLLAFVFTLICFVALVIYAVFLKDKADPITEPVEIETKKKAKPDKSKK